MGSQKVKEILMFRFHATSNGNIPFTPEEEAERDAEEAAYTAGENDRLATAARQKRDALLSQSDWMVTKAMESSASLNFEWASYRQALRDIPQQAGFPANIDWPVKPE
jgi:hypothetical protein